MTPELQRLNRITQPIETRKRGFTRNSLLSGMIFLLVFSLYAFFGIKEHQAVHTISAVGIAASLVAILFISPPFEGWLDGDVFAQELDYGRARLAVEDNLEAALAFQRALVYRNSWRAHFGLGFALEALGHLENAADEYQRARAAGVSTGNQVIAAMTHEYVRVLSRIGTKESKELALSDAEFSLQRFRGWEGPELDEIRLGRAFLLMSLRRDKEARAAFEELARTASDERIRRAGETGATANGLLELARLGPDRFFQVISKQSDPVQ